MFFLNVCSVDLEILDSMPDEAVEERGEGGDGGGGAEQLDAQVRQVVTETVAGVATGELGPERAGRVHQGAEHDLARDEGKQRQANLLTGAGVKLYSAPQQSAPALPSLAPCPPAPRSGRGPAGCPPCPGPSRSSARTGSPRRRSMGPAAQSKTTEQPQTFNKYNIYLLFNLAIVRAVARLQRDPRGAGAVREGGTVVGGGEAARHAGGVVGLARLRRTVQLQYRQ